MPSITINATDGSGSFAAYVAEPKSKPTGVVVLYPVHARIRKSLGEMTRKLSVTRSQ